TDSVSPTSYRLIDATRGGGVETYNLNQGNNNASAVDFTDSDNYWNNAGPELDDAATDAHWGMGMAYDYYQQMHGRNSYDDAGSAIVSYVHVDTAWFNASFNGLWAEFGDGNGNPLTSIDVASHELTHGVTGTSAGLVYQGQSGALNESFSDIFGTAVEFFAWPSQADWLIGQANFILRNMANPNAYGQPDTYQGTGWYNGPDDNGGVHTNSGVQNFWFYLLSEGGSGMNDIGNAFTVDSLGMEAAAAIAYRNLNYYLTSTSNYADARMGSLAAAEDLYGSCGYEVEQVMKAWYAVGVGPDTIAHDVQILAALAPNASCELGATEPVSFSFRYNRTGCAYTMNAGDTIQVGYQVDNNTPVTEDIILTNTLNEGDTIIHTFQSTVDLSVAGLYRIDYSVHINGDLNLQNDVILNRKVRKTLVLGANEVIGFEGSGAYLDSFYVETRPHSTAARSTAADNSGNYGFKMSGIGATPDNVVIPLTEAEIYQLNPDFGAKMCMCVDASTWNNVSLHFDLQQTFSSFYLFTVGMDYPLASSLRVLVNGTQVGDQYHPLTYVSDPYLSRTMNLDQFAGTQFDLCFESRHFINSNLIPGDVGDNSYLDNIFLTNMPLVGVEELTEADVKIYPVPTSGKLTIEMSALGKQQISLVDVTGKTILQQQWNANGGPLVLDLAGFSSGVYNLRINSGTTSTVRQIVVQ
ncbi:MAG: M4 family metallopeptidase, partial [Flavobacteriales bacterium]